MNTQLPDHSRVWVYQSQTEIPNEVQTQMASDLNNFISQWAAHGEGLYGDAFILENYFVVLTVDESKVGASGCSIDSSTRFVKELEKKYNLSLLDRLHVLTEHEGKKEIVHFADVKNIPERMIYNPMVKNLGDLRNNWKVQVKDWEF